MFLSVSYSVRWLESTESSYDNNIHTHSLFFIFFSFMN